MDAVNRHCATNWRPPQRRRWCSFSLQTLLVRVTIMGDFLGWLGWEPNIVQKRKAAIAELTAARAGIEMSRIF